MARKTHQQYVSEVKALHGPNIRVLSDYINDRTTLPHKCKIHNHVWHTKPNNILQGQGCPKCGIAKAAITRTRSHDDYVDAVKIVHGINITVIDPYVKSSERLKHRCNRCGRIWYPYPTHITKGHGCYCINRKQHTQYVEEIIAIHGDKITPLEEYEGYFTKIKHACDMGHEWSTTPNNILAGRACPACGIANRQCFGNKAKKFRIGGVLFRVRGYEKFALRWLKSNGFNMAEITGSLDDAPVIEYVHKDKTVRHYPDFYHRATKTIYEVKSAATIGLTTGHFDRTGKQIFIRVKRNVRAAMCLGYNYEMMLMTRKGKRIPMPAEWYKMKHVDFVAAMAHYTKNELK